MYKLFLSLKFLSHRVVNWICVVCVALAVTMLLAVMAIMGGFQVELLESYQSISSDLVINANRVRDFSADRLRERIELADHVEGTAYRFFSYGFLAVPGQIQHGGTAGIKVFGLDPKAEVEATDFRDHLDQIEGTARVRDLDQPFDTTPWEDPYDRTPPGILLGDKLYDSLAAYPGMRLQLTTVAFADPDKPFQEGDDQFNTRARQLTFMVTGAFQTGMYEYDNHTVYIPLETEYEFLGAGGGGREIYVRLDDYENAASVKEQLVAERLVPIEARAYTWEQSNRVFISAVQTEKMIQAVILSFMILLAGGAIMCVLFMTVIEKTRDVGTVKALGGTVSGILGIFALNGFIIGLLGSVVGLGLGVLIINNINFIDEQFVAKIIGHRIFRPEIYVFDEIPTAYNPLAMATTIGATLLISFIASLVPAWKASRFRPVEALRYE